jgi:hypothetical protein
MPVSLLELSDGGVSLELGAGDLDKVAEAICGRLGLGPLVTLERAALYDVVEVAGEQLLYYHEWDPCLISTSPAGARLLRRIYQVLMPNIGK